MPRRARLQLPGATLHLIQRGNNRSSCFYADEDYLFYLDHLVEQVRLHGCAIHAYCLMTNHAHLLVTPKEPRSVGLMMKGLGQHYELIGGCPLLIPADINGGDPFLNALMGRVGASIGYPVGNDIKIPFDKKYNSISRRLEWVEVVGKYGILMPRPLNPIPSTVGNIGDSALSGWFAHEIQKSQQVRER